MLPPLGPAKLVPFQFSVSGDCAPATAASASTANVERLRMVVVRGSEKGASDRGRRVWSEAANGISAGGKLGNGAECARTRSRGETPWSVAVSGGARVDGPRRSRRRHGGRRGGSERASSRPGDRLAPRP